LHFPAFSVKVVRHKNRDYFLGGLWKTSAGQAISWRTIRTAERSAVTLSQVPVRDSIMTCAFDEALSRIKIVPDFTPELVGKKVALMPQLPPGATLSPQVVLELKVNCPVTLMEEMVSAVAPLFVKVTVSGALVVPTAC
jgi:hypothetical protein